MSCKNVDRRVDEYFSSDSYPDYLLKRIKSCSPWVTAIKIYKKLKKYTLVTAIVRAAAGVIALLEKSAILLFTVALLSLPVGLLLSVIWLTANTISFLRMRNEISAWIKAADRITVYVTSEHISERLLSGGRSVQQAHSPQRRTNAIGKAIRKAINIFSQHPQNAVSIPETVKCRYSENSDFSSPLFTRMAMEEAACYDHPVIIVCKGRFNSAKWLGFNLLAIKLDCFFILKRFYFSDKKMIYTVLS